MDNNIKNDLYNKLYMELYNKNKASISRYNCLSVLGALSTISYGIGACYAEDSLTCGATWGLAAIAGIFTINILIKRGQLCKQIKCQAQKSVEQIIQSQEKINALLGPIASMFGLNLDFTGRVILDDKNVFEMSTVDDKPEIIEADFQVINDEPEKINRFELNVVNDEKAKVIENELQVINDDESQIALSQERAYALRNYIAQVAYQDYEDDLLTAETLLVELAKCKKIDSVFLHFTSEVNSLAQKAYFRALDLYSSMGR